MTDRVFSCAMRRRLGLAINFEGDLHGHHRLASNLDSRLNTRHTMMCCAWRQVFIEAGGSIPDRNVERMLRTTNVPIKNLADQRRLDLVVPGLNVYEGLPLFCDATIVSPLTGTGQARSGTSNRNGRLLEYAEQDNNRTYHEVISSGLGKLLCLGCEVYGRWSSDCIQLVPLLVREFTRGLHFHVWRGAALAFQRR